MVSGPSFLGSFRPFGRVDTRRQERDMPNVPDHGSEEERRRRPDISATVPFVTLKRWLAVMSMSGRTQDVCIIVWRVQLLRPLGDRYECTYGDCHWSLVCDMARKGCCHTSFLGMIWLFWNYGAGG